MYIGMSNDFYRPTKIASCAPGFKAHFPLGEFVRAKRKTNLGNAQDWSMKKFAAKKLDQFLFFYCSREEIRLFDRSYLLLPFICILVQWNTANAA
jgi:hypothetical protein